MNAVDQGDVLGDRARDFVRGNEMAEPLKGVFSRARKPMRIAVL